MISNSSQEGGDGSVVNINSSQTQSEQVQVSALGNRVRASHDRYYQKAYVVT